MRLYHFLSATYALAAIRDQRYKLSTYDNLNDPFELFASDLSDPKIRVVFRRFKEECARQLGLLCCSKSWRSTLLWSHYADKHRGVALELDVTDSRVVHVKYRSTRSPITRKLMETNLLCYDGNGVGSKMLQIKAKDWSYEDEARVLYQIGHLPRSQNGLHFCPFDKDISLTGVILGPLCSLSLGDLQSALPRASLLSVTKSRIAFRSFKVTPDLAFKPVRLVGAA